MSQTLKAFCVSILAAVTSLVGFSTAHALDQATMKQFSDQVTNLVCSDQGEWLRCYKVNPVFCTKVTEGFVQPCIQEILAPVEKQLSQEEGTKVALRLLGCFNKRFMDSYGSQKLSTPECANPPKHLQAQQ